MSESRNPFFPGGFGARSGVDPSISLAAGRGMEPSQSVLTQNPIAAMGGIAEIQNRINQNTLFQQTFAAKQAMGEIMATSPDVNTAMSRIQNSALAPFAGEFFNQIRQMQFTTAQINKTYREIGQGALGSAIIGMAGAYNDPARAEEIFKAAVGQATSGLDADGVRAAVPALQSLHERIFGNLPEGPARNQVIQQRILGTLQGTMNPDQMFALTGTAAPAFHELTGPLGEKIPAMVGGLPFGTGGGGGVGGPMVSGGAAGGPVGQQVAGGPKVSPLGIRGPTIAVQKDLDRSQELSQEMEANVKTLPDVSLKMSNMINALGQFQAGGWSSKGTALAQALQGFGKYIGASTDTIKEWTSAAQKGDLTAAQVFNANIKPYAINILKQSVQGTGKAFRPEVDAILSSIDQNTSPEAIVQLLNQGLKIVQVGYDKAQKFPGYRDTILRGGRYGNFSQIGDFESWYASNYGPNTPLPTQTEGGLPLGPVDIGRVMPVGKPPPAAPPSPPPPSGRHRTLDEIFPGSR